MTERSLPMNALAPTAFILALVATLAVAVRDQARWQTAAARPTAASNTTASPASPAPPPSVGDRHLLVEQPLFGTPAAEAPPPAAPVAPPVDESKLPASTASFQIYGLIEDSSAGGARAILGMHDGEQREYRIGDDAPDGARIKAVRARSLILERDGKLEQLALPELGLRDAVSPAAGTPPPFRRPLQRGAQPFALPDGAGAAMPSVDVPPPAPVTAPQ